MRKLEKSLVVSVFSKRTRIIILFFIASLFLAIVLIRYRIEKRKQFIRNSTELIWPSSFRLLESKDNHEWAFLAHLRIMKYDIHRFIKDNGMRDTLCNRVLPLFQHFDMNWRPIEGKIYCVYGTNDHNKWNCILEIASGEVWLTIIYPDFGGDLWSQREVIKNLLGRNAAVPHPRGIHNVFSTAHRESRAQPFFP